mgnify:CR=1 FL=1
MTVWGRFAMSNKKRKIKLGRRVTEALDLPEETVSGLPKLTVQGRERMLVENHRGIFECGERVVRLHTACGILRITGEALTLLELSAERLYIAGTLCGVEYEP